MLSLELNRWAIRLALIAALSLGVVMFVAGFAFGICGSMEYTTACNGLLARDPDAPYWAAFVLICVIGLCYSFVGHPGDGSSHRNR
jgi:hypothetical protein